MSRDATPHHGAKVYTCSHCKGEWVDQLEYLRHACGRFAKDKRFAFTSVWPR